MKSKKGQIGIATTIIIIVITISILNTNEFIKNSREFSKIPPTHTESSIFDKINEFFKSFTTEKILNPKYQETKIQSPRNFKKPVYSNYLFNETRNNTDSWQE